MCVYIYIYICIYIYIYIYICLTARRASGLKAKPAPPNRNGEARVSGRCRGAHAEVRIAFDLVRVTVWCLGKRRQRFDKCSLNVPCQGRLLLYRSAP